MYQNNRGSVNTTIETYDCSYVQYHPEEYVLYESNGDNFYIDEGTFEFLCAKFGNKSFRELSRDYHSIDGDMYSTTWQGSKESFVKYFTQHKYVNKVQASDGAFSFSKVAKDKLYDYPEFDPWEHRKF